MFRPFNRLRVTHSCGDELITKQEFKDECDINNILTQFKQTGIIQHIQKQTPIYSELPDELDYQTSLNIMSQASDAFSTLPSVVRRYFSNDPSRLLSALADPSMRETLEGLGVLQGPATPQPPGNPINRNPSFAGTLTTEPELPLARVASPPPTAPTN